MKENKKDYYYGTGRRKTSVARVFLRRGKGDFKVNKLSLEQYCKHDNMISSISQPLILTATIGEFDVYATVSGGGYSGQVGALRLGIARALVDYEEQEGLVGKKVDVEKGDGEVSEDESSEEISLRRILRSAGLLTRDSRSVERKKVGRHKARKNPQYSKR